MRIVSLVPSSTETLLALGAEVAACTRFCEQPDLTHVGGTKNPDLDAIVALLPDIVVMDAEENRIEDADALRAAGLEVLATDVRSMDDARRAVVALAEAAGVGVPPSHHSDAPEDPPVSLWARALVPIWRRPWMVLGSGTYGSSMLAHLGVAVVAPSSTAADGSSSGSGKYPTIELTDIADPPDLVLVPTEPYSFRNEHLDELADAFPEAAVQVVDGQDMFWWGIRTPHAKRRLAETLGRLT
ncbi:MAG: helical backbone metal receptor [Actinomycetota bacterium]|jgi:ABC-type Fe3+-hydroxamate transport system substrate-binding protein|nr:cobalamin-binding protein [Acidimicrobiia bacterium]MDQ3600885.1 helical backbone metal receptor [Actinomycetota bacterium]